MTVATARPALMTVLPLMAPAEAASPAGAAPATFSSLLPDLLPFSPVATSLPPLLPDLVPSPPADGVGVLLTSPGFELPVLGLPLLESIAAQLGPVIPCPVAMSKHRFSRHQLVRSAWERVGV